MKNSVSSEIGHCTLIGNYYLAKCDEYSICTDKQCVSTPPEVAAHLIKGVQKQINFWTNRTL